MTVTYAQKKAKEAWRKKNAEKNNRMNYKSNSKTFITKHATMRELLDLKNLIDEQIDFLKAKPSREPFGEYRHRTGEVQLSIISDINDN